MANHSIENPPPYEALSYTWGEDVAIRYVRCNGRDLAVTTSLIEALRQFRFPDKPRLLWIDQCCINQSNVEERSAQVIIMRQIYRNSSRVLSWFGPATANDGAMLQALFKRIDGAIDSTTALGRDIMKKGLKIPGFPKDEAVEGSKPIWDTRDNRNYYPSGEWLASHGLPQSSAPEWSVFEKFMTNAYFQRIWIIQEVRANYHVTIHWGPNEIPWVDIHNAARFCVVNGILERAGFPATNWSKFLIPFAIEARTSLTEFLTLTKAHKCADLRDQVFALVGVSWGIVDNAETKEVTLSANYALTWGQVFRDTIMAICKQSPRLDILTTFEHEPIPPHAERPSLVGKWESDPIFDDFSRLSSLACGDTIAKIGQHLDGDVLVTDGWLVDTVIKVNEPFVMPGLGLGKLGVVEAGSFEEAWTSICGSGSKEAVTAETLEDQSLVSYIPALAQTLRCNAAFIRNQTDPQVAHTVNLLSYALYQIDMALMALRGGSPLVGGIPPQRQFWPESDILAALVAFQRLNPSISSSRLESTEIIPVDKLYRYRRLVTNFFADSSTDCQQRQLSRLIAAKHTLNKYESLLIAPYWIAFDYNVTNLLNTRFFITASGKIGVGPNSMRERNQICILCGGPVPYVMREIPGQVNENWFLGGCYLHGMMQGEAMEEGRRKTQVERTFHFR